MKTLTLIILAALSVGCATGKRSNETAKVRAAVADTGAAIDSARATSDVIGTKLERAEAKNVVITEWLRRNR